jgi:hypothetical protein
MKKDLLVTLPAALALGGACLTVAPPSSMAADDYYGESARAVAAKLGCKNFYGNGSGKWHSDSGVCWIRGKRVNVIVFASVRKQKRWTKFALWSMPRRFYWASGSGAVVTAKNGNKRAARIGARRLPGSVNHGL